MRCEKFVCFLCLRQNLNLGDKTFSHKSCHSKLGFHGSNSLTLTGLENGSCVFLNKLFFAQILVWLGSHPHKCVKHVSHSLTLNQTGNFLQ